jgi:hypothetical protein
MSGQQKAKQPAPTTVTLDFGSADRAEEFKRLVEASGVIAVIKYGRQESFGNVKAV